MNCIDKGNFINHSRFLEHNNDNTIASEPVTPHQESLHSFRFSSSSASSFSSTQNHQEYQQQEQDLVLALLSTRNDYNYKEWSQQQHNQSFNMIQDKLFLSQQQIKEAHSCAALCKKMKQQKQQQKGVDSHSSNSSSSSSNNNDKSIPITSADEFVNRPPFMTRSESTTTTILKRHATSFTPSLYPSVSSQTTNKDTTTTTTATRYLPQNYAVITTKDDWKISLSNHMATIVFASSTTNEEELLGKDVFDFIEASHQHLLLDTIVNRRQDQVPCSTTERGNVLICGDVIPIVKQDGTKSSASLWLKEKKSHETSSIFIWIFEQVFSSDITIQLDDTQQVISIMDDGALFGYESLTIQQQHHHITHLIPQFLSSSQQQHSFFFAGAQTKYKANFPVMIKQVDTHTNRITSMPTLAGLVTVNNNIVTSCNAAFSKYLFGCSILDKPISMCLPQFQDLICALQQQGKLLTQIVNHAMCCDVFGGSQLRAMHQDGTLFDIELQLKQLSSQEYALWITFDRDAVFARYRHNTTKKPQEEEGFIRSNSVLNIPPTTAPATTTTMMQKKKSIPSFMIMTNTNNTKKNPTVATTKITSFSRPTFTSTTSAIQTTKQQWMNSNWPIGEYSAQTLKRTIVDYEVMQELGQGAYGLVKLAYLKNDPEKKHVVIKYVIKSRILIDCWTRDRKLGLIPAEIHVLHTLRKIPHINCSNMLDYFEDDDYYYIIMDLYGAGMDLFDYIEHGTIPEQEICFIFKQVVSAVDHLHTHGIVHRDIKDENVILDLKGVVRLIDFGSAAYVKQGKQFETFVGTLDYAAPEILKGQPYMGPPQDIWACGTLLYTLIYRENPFYNIDEIMEHELRIPFILSEESVDLISKMLDRNVDTRLTIHQVLDHPWLQI